MGGLKSRNKGKRGEREVANIFKAILGVECYRNDQSAGPYQPDIHVPGLWTEVKRHKKNYPEMAIQQAVADQAFRESRGHARLVPIVAWRDDRQPWKVSLRLVDLGVVVGADFNLGAADELVTLGLEAFATMWHGVLSRNGGFHGQ